MKAVTQSLHVIKDDQIVEDISADEIKDSDLLAEH